jgi:hypothetical protein
MMILAHLALLALAISSSVPCPANSLCLLSKEKPLPGEHQKWVQIDCDVYYCPNIDVPAIDDTRYPYETFIDTGNGIKRGITYNKTCQDKTRILEHDEQSPPRFWCRKVQP